MADEFIIRDINTGRIMGKTEQATRIFLYHVKEAQRKHGDDIMVVCGSLAHRDMRELINDIKAMGVRVERDNLPPDVVFIIQNKDGEHPHGYWEKGDY